MQIVGDILISLDNLRIWDHAFNCQRLDCIDVFNIFNEILIAYFFRIATSAIFPAEKVSKFLIFHQSKIIKYSYELISCDKIAPGSIVVLKRWLDKYSFAFDSPSNIVKNLI